MKMLSFFSIVASIFLSIGCKKEDANPEFVYPQLFTYQEISTVETSVFVKTASGYEKIDPVGNFATFKAEVMDNLSDIYLQIPFNKVTFHTDTTAELTCDIANADHFGLQMFVKYTHLDDLYTINITNGSTTYLVDMTLENSATEFAYYIKAVKNSYHTGPNLNLDYSPIQAEPVSSTKFDPVLIARSEEYGLQVGDTIAVNFSKLIYRQQ